MDVRASAQYISKNATFCRVNPEKCKAVSQNIKDMMAEKSYSTKSWAQHPLNPTSKSKDTVDWIFTVDTLNFSFWSDSCDSQRYAVNYNGQRYTGYWSLPAAINRALDEGIPITSCEFWGSDRFSIELLDHVFRSCTDEDIPLLQERYTALKEAAAAMKRAGATTFADIVERTNHSATTLVETVRKNMSSYNDVFEYKGASVRILKRAQILVGDLWACFEGEGYGKFDDIDDVTMFADYRVPQILQQLGCLDYSDSLERAIRDGKIIESGSEMEVELRGCSIWAVEEIRRYLPGTNSVLLDFYLWDTAKEQENEATMPCHKTRSWFY